MGRWFLRRIKCKLYGISIITKEVLMNGWQKISFSTTEISAGKQVKLVHELGEFVTKEFIISKRIDESVGVFSDADWHETINTYIAPTENVAVNAIAKKYQAVLCEKPQNKVALLVGFWKPLKDK